MERSLIRTRDFTPEELRKWQLRLLDILVYFRDFCEEHQLKFWLTGGTLLGAIRHKGFIPWDDDIDVQMPRDDYERLKIIWNNEADTSRFVCESPTEDRKTGFPMVMIRSVNTTCIYAHSKNLDICHGLKIDIEYLDGVPSNRIGRLINSFCAKISAVYRMDRFPVHSSFPIRAVSWILLRCVPSNHLRWKIVKLCENRQRKFSFDNSEYVRYSNCRIQKKNSFDKLIYVDFEGFRMPIPSKYDDVLKTSYDDYMQLPPEDERYPITDQLAYYNLDRSYVEFKGIYYCV